MRVEIDGERAILCDGCGTRLDGRENANKSQCSYGSTDPTTGCYVPKYHICRTTGGACFSAYNGGLNEAEAVAAYRAGSPASREGDAK